MSKNTIGRIILYSVLAISSFLLFQHKKNVFQFEAQKIQTAEIEQQKINTYLKWQKNISDTYNSLPIEGKEINVYDVKNERVLFQKNVSTPHTLASVTKLMTALIALQTLEASSSITISKKALDTEGDSGLIEGEVWPLEKLVTFTLIVSSNDGAQALAEAVEQKTGKKFVQTMNETATNMKLPSLFFSTPSGLDIEKNVIGDTGSSTISISGGLGNAQDVSKLAEVFIKQFPNIAKESTYEKATFIASKGIHQAVNTNLVISIISNPLLSKTGYTDMAGGNLVFAINAGTNQKPRPIIITILNSSTSGRFNDARLLASSTQAVLSNEPESL